MSSPQDAAAADSPWGIDISYAQDDTVDFSRVKAAGVQFMFIKITEGVSLVDKQFARNWSGSKAAGIIHGAYHFFRPKADVAKQIDNFTGAIERNGGLKPGDLPPVLDLEVPRDWKGLSSKRRVKIVLDWLQGVERRLSVRPIVYIGPSMAEDVLGSPDALKEYVLWLAHYTSDPAPRVPKPWTKWTFWQHSETGTVDGVIGPVDLDRFNGSRADLENLLIR